MTLPPGAFIEDGVVVYNDQGYTIEEWERRGNRPYRRGATAGDLRAYRREWMRRRRQDPDYIARERAQQRRYRSEHRPKVVGSLHGLSCTGPTKATGCRCHKTLCWDRPRLRLAP